METQDKKDNFKTEVSKLISEEKYGEAINYLQRIIESDNTNKEALTLIEQLKKILEYQNRDIYGSTNLDMDQWFQ